ncbi:MAG: hypothetical protein ACJ8AE_02100, partial [Gemmatimonadaceae bacterium]
QTFSSDANAQRAPASPTAAAAAPGLPRVSPLWQSRPEPLATSVGMHRVVWNPVRQRPRGAPPSDEGGPLDTRYIGAFTARLTVNGKVYTQAFTIKRDPRIG